MDFSSINWLAVIACVVSNMIIGSIWYNPAVFYKTWQRGLGKTGTEGASPAPIMWGLTIVAAFVEAIFVSMLVSFMGGTLAAGLQTGFMVWLGFVATTSIVNHLFAGRPWVVWLIETGNHLVSLLAMGAILGAWR
jgi:Protein of unknown function (DUF1761)